MLARYEMLDLPVVMHTAPTILVTGIAGFIGYHLAQRLLGQGARVVGIDNLNTYYDPALKIARLRALGIDVEQVSTMPLVCDNGQVTFYRADIADAAAVRAVFEGHQFDVVVHLAAQAGVRYSLEHPEAYVESNSIPHR